MKHSPCIFQYLAHARETVGVKEHGPAVAALCKLHEVVCQLRSHPELVGRRGEHTRAGDDASLDSPLQIEQMLNINC